MPWQTWTADRHPTIIARPNNRAGVSSVVDFAREQGLRIAIKSGGHNVSEAFLRDGGILLDLGELQTIEIDPVEKTAWVEPALWSHLLIEETEKHGLAFPVAHCASVPMGGYLLGGGVGLNGDEWGSIACHAIIAAEIVTADGNVVVASADQHNDLFWAVRGAGTGFFGVVLRYKLKLFPLPKDIYESMYFFPLDQIAQANRFLSDIAKSGIRKTELMMLMAHNPTAPPDAPAEQQKVCVARVVSFSDSLLEAKTSLTDALQHPALDHALFKQEFVPTSFKNMAEGSLNASAGLGFGRYAVDTVWTNKPAESLSSIKGLFAQAPDTGNHVVVSYKINPQLRDDASFSVIGDIFIGAYAVWKTADSDQANFDWTRAMGETLAPFATGKYINEVDAFRDPGVSQRCFDSNSWAKLSLLRNKYDPDMLFVGYSVDSKPTA